MKNILSIAFVFMLPFFGIAQETNYIDKKYLEDQLYISLSYNLLLNKPEGLKQKGFSGGVAAGFIKDIPINKQRNLAFGVGIGYSYNVYVQNLKVENNNFSIVTNYNSNKFSLRAIEFPIEFRWRTSTATKYKFWRIYGGLKLVYLINDIYKYSDNLKKIKVERIRDINKFQYGLTLSAGYGFWNLQAYYGLSSIFKANTYNKIKELRIGLIFYML